MGQAVRARVTAAEYVQLPETNQPMELIDGEVIQMPGPQVIHQRLARRLLALLEKLVGDRGELFFAPTDIHLDDLNVVQPDLLRVSGPESRCKLGEDGYWHGAPDLVIEILSEGTGLRDRREKFKLYEKHGSQEYWLAEPGQKYVEVWGLTKSQFRRLGVFGPEDTFESPVLGGAKVELKGVFEK